MEKEYKTVICPKCGLKRTVYALAPFCVCAMCSLKSKETIYLKEEK